MLPRTIDYITSGLLQVKHDTDTRSSVKRLAFDHYSLLLIMETLFVFLNVQL